MKGISSFATQSFDDVIIVVDVVVIGIVVSSISISKSIGGFGGGIVKGGGGLVRPLGLFGVSGTDGNGGGIVADGGGGFAVGMLGRGV